MLALYVAALGYAGVWYGRVRNNTDRHQWLPAIGLCVAAIVAAQLFLVNLPSSNLLPPIDTAETPTNLLRVLAFVPILLAAYLLDDVPLVVVVGLAGGLGRIMWQSHYVLDIFPYAAAAWLAAVMVRQQYEGRFYRILRIPAVAAPFALLLVVPIMTALNAYAYTPPEAGGFVALDLSRSVLQSQLLLSLLEGLSSGLLMWGAVWAIPQLRLPAVPEEKLHPSPFQRTLSRRLISRFALYSAVLLVTLSAIVFYLSLRVSTDLVIDQMIHDANTVSNNIPVFRDVRQNLLVQYSRNRELLASDAQERQDSLRQLFRTGQFYRRVMLIDVDRTAENPFDIDTVGTVYPPVEDVVSLNNLEKIAVINALTIGAPVISRAFETADSRSNLTFVAPIRNENGTVVAALAGRVTETSLQDLVDGVSGTVGSSTGFIVDEEDRIIAHTNRDSLLTNWQGLVDEGRNIRRDDSTGGIAYEGRDGQTNARRLVYYVTGPRHPWTVVITVPYEIVLGRAWQTGMPIIGVLVLATVIFTIVLAFEGNSIAMPLAQLVRAAGRITAGEYNTPIESVGNDEVGQLGRAFMEMQRALRKRLQELTLLLNVSQNVSTSLNRVSEGLVPILRGALRGTGASGVRMAVINPNGRHPLIFGEGPAAEQMAAYDRQMTRLLRRREELMLPDPASIRKTLNIRPEDPLPFKAVIGLAIFSQQRPSGVFWLAYRQPHAFDETELNLLRTLASQATVLLENARLFATAEGGRRRLAAVLASTTDAVIVTDPTDRILLLNPAMERAFDLSFRKVRNRLVQDVIEQDELVEVLTTKERNNYSLEVPLRNGRTFFASASAIITTDGQALGRVAVLHDITRLKELDEMKSTFVQMVSHDLRSPLTYMTGFINMLPMVGDLNTKQQEYIHKIENGVEQMNTLVKNLLDLGRLEAGLELMRAPTQMADVLQAVVDTYQPMAEENGMHIEKEIVGKLPYMALDSALVQQAVGNLVMNAIKYAPESGPLTLKAELVGQEVVVSVADNGPGIPREDQIRLFEKFYRVKQRQNVKIKGSGLGLAIVKSVAERHGGRAWFESEEGEGSTFYLSFPLSMPREVAASSY